MRVVTTQQRTMWKNSQFLKTDLGVLQHPTTKALCAQPSISSEVLHAPDNATGMVSSFAGKTGCAHWWSTVLEPGPSHHQLHSFTNLNEVWHARPHYCPLQGQQHGNSACCAHSPGNYWLLLMVNWWGWSMIIMSLEIGQKGFWWWVMIDWLVSTGQ